MAEEPVPFNPPKTLVIAVAWLCLIILGIVMVKTRSATGVDLANRLQVPGVFSHLLGTDTLGRDGLARLLVGMRVSFEIALTASVISMLLGTTLGLLAAKCRGWVEQIVLMLIDFQASLPFLIIALAVLAFAGITMTLFACLMGLYGWERHARMARSLAISAEKDEYVLALRQLGAGSFRIYYNHLLPNIAASLIVSFTLGFPEIVLMESGLSFLGVGVQQPAISLGTLVATGRDYMANAPWLLLAPSIVIVGTTLAISVIGDWLRDRLDPTLR
jgi:peptide/nickel transport system permease protein